MTADNEKCGLYAPGIHRCEEDVCGCDGGEDCPKHGANNEALKAVLGAGKHLDEANALDFGFDREGRRAHRIWFEPHRIACAGADTAMLETLARKPGAAHLDFDLANRQDYVGVAFYDVFFGSWYEGEKSPLPALVKYLREERSLDVGPNRALFPVPIHMFESHKGVHPVAKSGTGYAIGQNPRPHVIAGNGSEGEPADLDLDWRFVVVDSGVDQFHEAQLNVEADFDDLDTLRHFGRLDRVPGHGTFIAGLLASYAQGVQIEMERADGVEYRGREAVRLLDERTALRGIHEALGETVGPTVLVLAFGSYGYRGQEFVAIRNGLKGLLAANPELLVVAAAGNCDTDDRFFPAAFADEIGGVVSVGAAQRNAKAATFSNRGSWVKAVARGEAVTSTYPVDAHLGVASGLAEWSGTSFAAPRACAEIARWAHDWAQQNTPLAGPRSAWEALAVVAAPKGGGPDTAGGLPYRADFKGHEAVYLGFGNGSYSATQAK